MNIPPVGACSADCITITMVARVNAERIARVHATNVKILLWFLDCNHLFVAVMR